MNFITFSPILFAYLLLSSLGLSCLVSFILRQNGQHLAMDVPDQRRIHQAPIPRVGGIAIWFSFVAATLIFVRPSHALLGFLIAATFIFLVGLIDDFVQLPPFYKFTGQILAALILTLFGIGIGSLTNPLGGVVALGPLINTALTIIWVVLVVNAVNFLDGLDGLSGSVSTVAALTIGLLSLLAFVGQSQTATLSFILAGAILGFLIFNFHPAKLFMGDSGSHFLGFALATLAIISGGKIATAALVLGVPLIDFFWSSWRRMREGRSPFAGDLEHLHHRLLKMGLAQGQVVMIFVVLSALFGVLGLFGGTWFKIAAFLGLIMLVVLIMSLIGRRRHFRA